MSEGQHEVRARPSFTRLDVGVLITLTSMAIAAVVGLIAVFDTGNGFSAIAIALGVTAVVFVGGASMACALACLVRRRLEIVSLAGLVAAGLLIDLVVLGVWLDPDGEWFGRLVGVAAVWSFFALLILGLDLAAQPRDRIARGLRVAAIAMSLLGGVLASVLVIDVGEDDLIGASIFGFEPDANESVLRPLAAVLVITSALWLSVLAASRVERAAG